MKLETIYVDPETGKAKRIREMSKPELVDALEWAAEEIEHIRSTHIRDMQLLCLQRHPTSGGG